MNSTTIAVIMIAIIGIIAFIAAYAKAGDEGVKVVSGLFSAIASLGVAIWFLVWICT